MLEHDPSKRRFIKTATYVAPAILTLKVAPTFASGGSGRGKGHSAHPDKEHKHRDDDGEHGHASKGGHHRDGDSSPKKKKRHEV